MHKIKTIFDRDWDGNHGVIPKLLVHPGGTVTEKLDGTNVRVTVRDGTVVRIEARRNPPKGLKRSGIEEPWYRDAWQCSDAPERIYSFAPSDRYIIDGVLGTPLSAMPDGEWSGEVVGPKVQGNPLLLDEHRVYFFGRDLPIAARVPVLDDVPALYQDGAAAEQWYFEALHGYLQGARSRVNPEAPIEGIVWHVMDKPFAKIKLRDFKD